MPVVHDRTTDVTQNEPEDSPEDRFECRIHDRKNNREKIGVKRKSSLVAATLISVEFISQIQKPPAPPDYSIPERTTADEAA